MMVISFVCLMLIAALLLILLSDIIKDYEEGEYGRGSRVKRYLCGVGIYTLVFLDAFIFAISSFALFCIIFCHI